MPKYILMRTRKNQALEEIEKQGLNPDEFEWTEERKTNPGFAGEDIISVLVHRPTEYTFCFDIRHEVYFAIFSPGDDAPRRHETCVSLPQVMGHFVGEWLPSLKREIEAPDLWAELGRAKSLTEAARTTDDAAFTADQREQVVEGIGEIRTWLLDQAQVQQHHAEFVTERLAYLESAIERMSRRDWLHTAIGVLFTLAVGIGLAPDKARKLFRVAGDALTKVVEGVVKFLE